MRILLIATLLAALTGCTNSIANCDDYAAEVRSLIEDGASPERLETYLQETEEQVARLISRDPDAADACVGAVLEATCAIGFGELESLLDG